MQQAKRKKRATAFDEHRQTIVEYMQMGLNVTAIAKIINANRSVPVTYHALSKYMKREGLTYGA